MSINKALDNILEGKLDEMRENFSAALSTKAVEKLEERKIEIAQNYFGQVFESSDQIDEVTSQLVGRAANKAEKLAQWHSDNDQHIAGKAYDDQSKRLWAKADEKRKKENVAKQLANLSSGKKAKLKKKRK